MKRKVSNKNKEQRNQMASSQFDIVTREAIRERIFEIPTECENKARKKCGKVDQFPSNLLSPLLQVHTRPMLYCSYIVIVIAHAIVMLMLLHKFPSNKKVRYYDKFPEQPKAIHIKRN